MKFTSTKRIFLIAMVCVAFASSAFGESRVISRAYEVLLENFQAPQSINGMVSFKECSECGAVHLRVDAATRYAVNGRTVELDDFRLALTRTSDRSGASITVLHHLESDSVEAVDAWL